MARITVEDCMEKVPSRFALVMLAVKRTKQILEGSDPQVDADNKEIILALRELAYGKVKMVEMEKERSSKKPPRLVPVSLTEEDE
jgi:DNA-directed RNA polymerase subunit omega